MAKGRVKNAGAKRKNCISHENLTAEKKIFAKYALIMYVITIRSKSVDIHFTKYYEVL